MQLSDLADILRREACSLVLQDAEGRVRLFHQQGVRDLEHLLDHEPGTLRGARVADKVVGKAAAAMMACGGVREVYAEVMSRKATPLLEADGIGYAYGQLVDNIIVRQGDTRCPLEQIVEEATTAEETVALLRQHFMRKRKERT